jgi:hypothetical protein
MKITKAIAMFGATVALCAVFAASASAQCGLTMKRNQGTLAAVSTMAGLNANTPLAQSAPAQSGEEQTLVGFWDIKFIADNQVVDEGFDQFHSDGLEILNDTSPPVTGNICLGTWTKTGGHAYKLKHPFWIFDPDTNTTVIGRGMILERITVDHGGQTLSGTFTFQLRDLSGNPLAPDTTGQIKGDRITPD